MCGQKKIELLKKEILSRAIGYTIKWTHTTCPQLSAYKDITPFFYGNNRLRNWTYKPYKQLSAYKGHNPVFL